MDPRLLTTCDVFEPEVITEAVGNHTKMMLRGVLQAADTLNQNGRVYPRHILEREIRNYQKFINENRALGELDHPETSVVELKNVSHIVREAKMQQDGKVMGTIEILDTPSGKIVKNLVQSGVKIGISSRGVGSVKKEGDYNVVQEDYILVCWDIVQEPSTPNAFMLPEGKRLSPGELKAVLTRSDRISRIVNDILSK